MTESYKDLFRGTAWYYARHRSSYPEAFFKAEVQKHKIAYAPYVEEGYQTNQ